jgi:hypothetical protein
MLRSTNVETGDGLVARVAARREVEDAMPMRRQVPAPRVA